MRVGVVGAGIAGLACAKALEYNGHVVVLYDKGRRPGGRTSSRRITTPVGDAFFDYGAQYFTVHDSEFRQQVDIWVAQGVVAPWPAAGDGALVGVPDMGALAIHLAQGLSIKQDARVVKIDDWGGGWRFALDDGSDVDVDVCIIATPSEQAVPLLMPSAPDLALIAQAIPSEPCWTVMMAFEIALKTTQDFWSGGGIIEWAARNNSKPGRLGAESWVVQANSDWSKSHIEADRTWVASTLLAALSAFLDVEMPHVSHASSHLWRFARSGSEGSGPIFDRKRRLGVCGDWLFATGIEAAWRSGTLLAQQIGVRT